MSTVDRIVDAVLHGPDAVSAARDTILSLAFTGRLVVGCGASDTEALDAALEDGRKRLSKAGFTSGHAVGYRGDVDSERLPAGWRLLSLGEVGVIVGGATPSTGNPAYWADGDDIPWLTPADLGRVRARSVSRGTRDITELGLKESSARLLPAGSVLFSSRAPIGHVAIAERPVATNQGFKSIVPFIPEMSEYLYWFLRHAAREIDAAAPSTTFREVSGKAMAQVHVPVPALEEQQRIVERIQELMALCDELEAKQAAQHELRTNATGASLDALVHAETSAERETAWQRIADNFHVLFDDVEAVDALGRAVRELLTTGALRMRRASCDDAIHTLLHLIEAERALSASAGLVKKRADVERVSNVPVPKGWELVQLGDIVTWGPRNGFSPRAVEYETPTRSLTLSATTTGSFLSHHFKYIDAQVAPDSYLWLQPGDMLVQRGNTIEYVGVPALYEGEPNAFVYPDLMMKLRVASVLEPRFVHLALLSDLGRGHLRSRASGTSGSMPKINQGDLLSTPVLLPPVAEQRWIVKRYEQLTRLTGELKKALESRSEIAVDLSGILGTVGTGVAEG